MSKRNSPELRRRAKATTPARSRAARPSPPGRRRTPRKPRLFVIGAGASYAAGLPDASRLPVQVFGYIGNAPWEVVRNRPPYSYFKPLNAVLQKVLQDLATGGPQSKWPMDAVFERFGELLSQDPQRFGAAFGQLFEATAQVLYQRSQYGATTDAYQRFIETLTDDDLILSFNWDVCLEIAMQRAGRPLHRALDASTGSGPRLLKLNGSIDHLIVNTSATGKTPRAARPPRKGETWWARFPFLDTLRLSAPSAPDTAWTESRSQYELARLRTYDLAGYEMQIGDTPTASIGRDAIDEAESDVGPFTLLHALPEYPTLQMIGPGTPTALSSWYYLALRSAIAPIASSISRVYVVGYSFPVYDLPVLRLLREIVQAAGHPPADIVNPDASRLPREPLQFVFGGGQLRLHGTGFEAFDWQP